MTNSIKKSFPAVSNGTIGGEKIQTVNARDLHAFLEVGKVFAAWINERIEQYNFIENQDFIVFSETGKNPTGGRPAKEYAISIDMGKELAMVERNEKGKQARQYFIECERRAKDPIAALSDPATLKNLLLENINKVMALESKVEQDKPKTHFYDEYVNADGLYGLQNAARALACHPNKFAQWLKQDYLFYQGGNLVPRIRFIQKGYFEIKVTIIDDKARSRTFITPKGLEYFSNVVPDYVKLKAAA